MKTIRVKIIVMLLGSIGFTSIVAQNTFREVNSLNIEFFPKELIKISKNSVLVPSYYPSYPTASRFYISKFDTSGVCLWTKKYSSYDAEVIRGAVRGPNQSILTFGARRFFPTFPFYYQNLFPTISSYSLNGTVQNYLIAGDPYRRTFAQLEFITPDKQGNIIFGGQFDMYDEFHLDYEVYVFGKMDSLNNFIYCKRIYDTLGIAQFLDNFINSINFQDSTSIIIGQTEGTLLNPLGAGRGNFFMKINAIGDTIWTKNYDDFRPIVYSRTPSISINTTTSLLGGFVLNQTYHFDMVWFTMDSSGTVTKGFTFDAGMDERMDKFMMCSDSSLVFCGSITDSTGNQDAMVIKTDLSGNVLWAKRYGQANTTENAVNAVELSSGNLLILGTFVSPVTGFAEMLLFKTDAQGQSTYCDETNLQVTVTPFTMSHDTTCYSLRFLDALPFYSSYLNASADSFSSYDPCVPLSVKENLSFSKVKVFPNPARERLFLQSSVNTSGLFVLRDITGRVQISQALNPNFQQTEISLSNLASGVYFWEIICTNEERQTGKLVKE